MKETKNKKIELLAPAGNIESFKTAINNGADAIYLGLDDFNARNNIENFNITNLHNVVDYAHLFNVKIYLALNVLIKDNEFEKVYALVKQALNSKVDAFIIQDIGLAYFLKQKFPNIELHASTQMGFNNLEGVLFAKKIGFKRVVLARETSLTEIKRIKDNCDIELEYFVQGALCVAYSGNCYLCSLLANSSGNRGKCKQFCRLEYSMENKKCKKEGYLLSTKDFCMLSKLKELYEAGICSFKIEGRARRPAYVAQAVNTYRKAINNNFSFSKNDIIDLKKVFNRGNFSCGYLENDKIIYSKCQNHIGIEIGKVVKFIKGKNFNEIYIETKENLNKNDVLKFFLNNKEIGIIAIKDLQKIKNNLYKITTTNYIENGAEARLIIDYENENKVLNNSRQIKIDITFFAFHGEKAKIIFNANATKIIIESDNVVDCAKTNPLTEEECFVQFSKLGEEFCLNSLTCHLDNAFIVKSQFNDLRRKSLQKLKEKILLEYEKDNFLVKKKVENNSSIELFNTKQQIKNVAIIKDFENFEKIKTKYQMFIYQPQNIDFTQIINIYKKFGNYKIFISFPILVNNTEIEIIKNILKECANWGIYANNYYALTITSAEKTFIGSNMNVFNSYTVKLYSILGFNNIALSIEETDFSSIFNCDTCLYLFTSFYPEYMFFKHCPLKEHFGSSCDKCLYKNDFICRLNNKTFNLIRRKFLQCHFVLKSKTLIKRAFPQGIASIEEPLAPKEC